MNQWPATPPRDSAEWVHRAETAAELAALRQSVKRGRPFGDEPWQERTAEKLELKSTLNPRGRPPAK